MDDNIQKALDTRFKTLEDSFVKAQNDLVEAQKNNASKDEILKLTKSFFIITGDSDEMLVCLKFIDFLPQVSQ